MRTGQMEALLYSEMAVSDLESLYNETKWMGLKQ